MAGAVDEHIQYPSKSKAGIGKLIEQSVDCTVTAQNSALDFAAKQTKAVSDTVSKQPEVAGTPVEAVTDSVQRGFETVVTAQKEILNNAAKATKKSAAKA
jgi:gas vesicle protein